MNARYFDWCLLQCVTAIKNNDLGIDYRRAMWCASRDRPEIRAEQARNSVDQVKNRARYGFNRRNWLSIGRLSGRSSRSHIFICIRWRI